jgi:hypothetical protein
VRTPILALQIAHDNKVLLVWPASVHKDWSSINGRRLRSLPRAGLSSSRRRAWR